MSCNHLNYCQRCENYTESLERRIADLTARLAAAEADAERYREGLHDLIESYLSSGGGSPDAHRDFMAALRKGQRVLTGIEAARGGE